ncbi:MAG TPA: alpha/beta hydrolase [Myxococcales bacterium]|nr:alpha/beta hydrolase [Myxococcales bacterium]
MTPAKYTRSPDGTRIAYDAIGRGEPLVLLHGGFIQDRRSWWTAGYVERLQQQFRLLIVDLRGHGESDHPTSKEAYAADKVCADVMAAMDAEAIEFAPVWGYSYGAGVALQMVLASDRVQRMALGGAALGHWLTAEQADKSATGMRSLAQARRAGAADQLPPEHRDFARRADLDSAPAIFEAMSSWPAVEPRDLSCPALFYAGSHNALGAGQIRTHQDALKRAGARWLILDGLDHLGEFNALDRSLPPCVEFLRAR